MTRVTRLIPQIRHGPNINLGLHTRSTPMRLLLSWLARAKYGGTCSIYTCKSTHFPRLDLHNPHLEHHPCVTGTAAAPLLPETPKQRPGLAGHEQAAGDLLLRRPGVRRRDERGLHAAVRRRPTAGESLRGRHEPGPVGHGECPVAARCRVLCTAHNTTTPAGERNAVGYVAAFPSSSSFTVWGVVHPIFFFFFPSHDCFCRLPHWPTSSTTTS